MLGLAKFLGGEKEESTLLQGVLRRDLERG